LQLSSGSGEKETESAILLKQNAGVLNRGIVLEVEDHGLSFSREIEGITRRREAAKFR
jgi:hypothetical protein